MTNRVSATGIKLVIVGDSSVGKTCLLDRYVSNQFNDTESSTIGSDYKRKTVLIDNELISVSMWDTAGQERFRALVRNYYRDVQGVIFVYDVTDPDSFKHLQDWIMEVEQHGGKELNRIILGNKCDLSLARRVTYEQGEEFAKSVGVDFAEVSALSASNVEIAFLTLLSKVQKRLRASGGLPRRESIRLQDSQPKKSSGSCCSSSSSSSSSGSRTASSNRQDSRNYYPSKTLSEEPSPSRTASGWKIND